MKPDWAWAFTTSITASILLHVAGLSWAEPSQRGRGLLVNGGARVIAHGVVTRETPSPAGAVTLVQVQRAAPTESEPQARDLEPQPPAEAERPTASVNQHLDLMPLGWDDFVPSKLLSRPQLPLSEIIIKLPDGPASESSHSVRLTLLIDEIGYVLDVIPEVEPTAPQQYVEAALEAFAKARFTPGIRDGLPVRTRMQLEVSFGDAASETTE